MVVIRLATKGRRRCGRAHRARPRDVVCIEVNHTRRGIKGRATPLGSTIKPGEYYGLPSEFERHELPGAPERSKLFGRPLVRLWSPGREHVLREKLARKRERLGRKRLRLRRDFAVDHAR